MRPNLPSSAPGLQGFWNSGRCIATVRHRAPECHPRAWLARAKGPAPPLRSRIVRRRPALLRLS
jgi:hypothetical protein